MKRRLRNTRYCLGVLLAVVGLGCSPGSEAPSSEPPSADLTGAAETPPPASTADGSEVPRRSEAPCPTAVSIGEGPQRVALVVSFEAQQHVARCIAFDAAELSAFELLRRSGLESRTQYHVAYDSHTLCQLASSEGWSQGCDYPDEDCFCDPDGAFWSFWRPADGGGWQKSQLGLEAVMLGAGDLFAQHWSAVEGPPPSCSYDDICSSSPASSS